MSGVTLARQQAGIAQDLAIEASLHKLEQALCSGRPQELREAADELRVALQSGEPIGERELSRYCRSLASCAELLGRSISANNRALAVFFPQVASGPYRADGAAAVDPRSSFSVRT